MVAPRALVSRPLVKGNGDSGNEIEFKYEMFAASHLNWNKLTLGVCLLFYMLCKKKPSRLAKAWNFDLTIYSR